MTKFKVAIEEHLVREVEIEATDMEEAMEKVEEQWRSSKIVLDADDFKRALIAGLEPIATEWTEIT